jgi:hypothetical protein
MKRTFLVFSAALALAGCSRTAPDTRWPPPGPAGGLPYVPLPDDADHDARPRAAIREAFGGRSGQKVVF